MPAWLGFCLEAKLLKLLEFVHQSSDDVKAALPEFSGGNVHASLVEQVDGRNGTTRGQDAHVLGLEAFAFFLVALIERKHQKLAKGVGINIGGCSFTVRKTIPLLFEFIRNFNRVAKVFL